MHYGYKAKKGALLHIPSLVVHYTVLHRFFLCYTDKKCSAIWFSYFHVSSQKVTNKKTKLFLNTYVYGDSGPVLIFDTSLSPKTIMRHARPWLTESTHPPWKEKCIVINYWGLFDVKMSMQNGRGKTNRKWYRPRPKSSVFSIHCTYTGSIHWGTLTPHWHTLTRYTGPLVSVYRYTGATLGPLQCMHSVQYTVRVRPVYTLTTLEFGLEKIDFGPNQHQLHVFRSCGKMVRFATFGFCLE